MQPSEKAGEPSMEDILASIRKIIADDPSVTAGNGPPAAPTPPISASSLSPSLGFPQPARAGMAATAQPPMPSLRMSPASQVTPAPPAMSSLEQELADLLREPVEVPPAARPLPAQPVPLSVGHPASPTAGPANAPATAGFPTSGSSGSSGLTAWLRGKPKADPPRPEQSIEPPLEPTSAARPEPEITPFLPDAVAPHEAAIPAMIAAAPTPSIASPPQPVAPPSAPAPSIAATSPKGSESHADAPVSMQAILERLNTPAGPGPSVVIKPPVPTALKSRTFVASPAISARPFETLDAPVAPANRLMTEPQVPATDIAEIAVAAPAPVIAPSAPAAGPPPAVAMSASEIPPDPVAATAEAAAVAPAPVEPVKVEQTVLPVLAEAVAAPSAPVETDVGPVVVVALSAPETSAPAASVAEITPAAPVATSPAAGEGTTSFPGPVLEDMLAEAMRPMVRQWIDENMRAALEKALRAEMSGSLLSVLDKMKVGDKP
jgi:hypothetical protein